jgi:integrase
MRLRQGDNPARWKGNLRHLLPVTAKLKAEKHHPALPYSEIGGFMAALRQREGVAARALEFCILTAARSGEVFGATWQEIDLSKHTWTVPGARMKGGVEHVVPLSDAALAVLEKLPRIAGTELVFPSPMRGSLLSDMSLSVLIRRMHDAKVEADGRGYIDPKQNGRRITPHGFRSAFSDWVAETTAYPTQVREYALAHGLRNKVEAAYQRGNLLDKRVPLMQDWARFVGTVAPVSGEVVQLRRGAA